MRKYIVYCACTKCLWVILISHFHRDMLGGDTAFYNSMAIFQGFQWDSVPRGTILLPVAHLESRGNSWETSWNTVTVLATEEIQPLNLFVAMGFIESMFPGEFATGLKDLSPLMMVTS